MGSPGTSTEALGCTASLCAPEKLVSPDVPAVPSRHCTALPTVSFGTVLILFPREIMLISTLNSAARALVVVVVVGVVSHIQRIGCQPEKNYFTRWPIPLVVC